MLAKGGETDETAPGGAAAGLRSAEGRDGRSHCARASLMRS